MDLVLTAEVYPADRTDTMTLVDSVMAAQGYSSRACRPMPIEAVMADNGYHAAAHHLRWILLSLLGVGKPGTLQDLGRASALCLRLLTGVMTSPKLRVAPPRLATTPCPLAAYEAPFLRKLGYFNGADKHVSACRNCWVSASTE